MKNILSPIITMLAAMFLMIKLDAQNTIHGQVIDSATNKPIAGVNIYVNSSAISTTSNEKGQFQLQLSDGIQMLVFSREGFHTCSHNMEANKNNGVSLTIKLHPLGQELEEVTVKSTKYRTVKGKDWKNRFMEYFIGTGEGARDCEIRNFSDIVLQLSEDNTRLRAHSGKTVEILNRWLGYRLFFDMEDFTVDLQSGIVVNDGYTRFENTGDSKKIKEHRADRYLGSLIHFLRSLYSGNLMQEGFAVHRVVVQDNHERKRVLKMLESRLKGNDFYLDAGAQQLRIGNSPPDSSAYYYQVYARQRNQTFLMDSALLTPDSLVVTDLGAVKEVYFEKSILVTYRKRLSEAQRLSLSAYWSNLSNGYENSVLSLNDDNSILLYPNGLFSPPRVLFVQGFWRESNCVKNMLPFDYIPSNH